MIVPFLPQIDSKRSEPISSRQRSSCENGKLGDKLQRLALTHPEALKVLEHVVDQWLADDEGEAS